MSDYYPCCVVCGSDNIVQMMRIYQRGIPHGEPGHNIAYDHKIAFSCMDCRAITIEIYSHDCWTIEEPWDLVHWYAFKGEDVKRFWQMAQSCRKPMDYECGCNTHDVLNKKLTNLPRVGPYARDTQTPDYFGWLKVSFVRMDKEKFVVDKEAGRQPVGQAKRPNPYIPHMISLLYFAAYYIVLVGALNALAQQTAINPSGMKIGIIALSALGAAQAFMQRCYRLPTIKDSAILTTGSLCIYIVVVLSLQFTAGLPIIPVIMIPQIITGLAVLFPTYHWLTRKVFAKQIPDA